MELNKELSSYLKKPSSSPGFDMGSSHRGNSPGPLRPKYSSKYSPLVSDPHNARAKPSVKPPSPGPPPGAYDVTPKWDTAHVVPMAPPIIVCKKKHETMPGPG
jgi:hypothetical protein